MILCKVFQGHSSFLAPVAMTVVATISLPVYLTPSPQGVQHWIFPSDGHPPSYQPRSPGLTLVTT